MPNKEDFQKELKEKVKEGVKPSDLRRLKKSKSDSNIPKTSSPLSVSTSLTRSKSNQSTFSDPKYPYTTLISQQEELDKLKKETSSKSTTIGLLRKKIDELEQVAPQPLLTDQLKEKQKEIEDLRKKLEEKQATTELDNSLLARRKSLKD
jgi:hypothetical protein